MNLSVEEINGRDLVRELAEDVGAMMNEKVQAVTRIGKVAENAALDHEFDKDLKLDDDLSANPGNTVHVASSVVDADPLVINTIDWSRKLDDTFQDNFIRDPTLSSQYFGSSNGVLRQFPAIKWPESQDRLEMQDARTQSWYTNAAASSKVCHVLRRKL